MTSLIDVLFILVFASLVQSAAARKSLSAAPTAPVAPLTGAPDAGVVMAALDAGVPGDAPPVDRAGLRDQALSALAAAMATRPVLIARVSRDGVLTALELPDRRIELGAPLLERVPDRDVVVAYLGDRTADLQICRIAALRLGAVDLAPYLVVIAPDAPLAELQVALVAGLGRDAARCQRDQGVAAVLIDPGARAPSSPPRSPPPSSPSPGVP